MKEHIARFNLFDYVCINNEHSGLIVDFDLITRDDSDDGNNAAGSKNENTSVDAVASVNTLNRDNEAIPAVKKTASSENENSSVDEAKANNAIAEAALAEVQTSVQQKSGHKQLQQTTEKPLERLLRKDAGARIDARRLRRRPLHMSSVNQFISEEVLSQVDQSQIEDQVYYWVLCEQGDSAVMAFVPEDFVQSADEAPSQQLLDSLNAWCAQTNIQYQH